jgi:hypothetical protein
MSTTINQNNEEVTAGKFSAADRLAIREEIRAIQKGTGRSAWYNPAKTYERSDFGKEVEPDTVFLGESNGAPTYEEPVFNMAKFREARTAHKTALKSGSKFDWGMYENPWLGEWNGVNQEYEYLKKNRRLKSAAIGTNSDFAAIDVVNVLAEMVNTELRNFVLTEAVTTIGTPQLNLNVDTYTRFTNSQGVPEGVAPQTKRPGVSRTAFNLTKDVGHIAMTDEAQLRAVHDMFRQAIDTAVTDFRRIKSNKVATELETATSYTTNVADWQAMSTDHNTTAPQFNLGAAADIIFSNNGNANIISTHDKAWRNFLMSTYVKGVLQAIPQPDLALAKVITNVPSLPGFTWYVDNEHTVTIGMVFDKAAVFLMQGPVRVAQYRMEQEGVDGYIYRDWNLPKIVIGGRVRKISPITA